MNTRTVRIFCLGLLLLLIPSLAWASPAPEDWLARSVEMRGVWMDKGSIPKTEQGIRALIRSYAKAGINVVYPEVIFNGYSAYPSSYLTQKDLWNGIDMLGILTDEAHERGIEVHPWVWVFRVGNVNDKGGILTQHPDWVALNKDGKPFSDGEGYWLCPSLPAARRLLFRAIAELVRKYPVDGIQLDYIRFDYQDPVPTCYNESCRRRFQAEHGIDPQEIEPLTEPSVTWHMWRENLVNTFVRDVSRELRSIRPELKVSAAVVPDPKDSRLSVLQDWRHWAVNGWVDFLAPMSYTGQAMDFLDTICEASTSVGFLSFLAPGIGLQYLGKEPGPMLEQIRVSRSSPVAGVTLFASAYLEGQHLDALAAGPYRKRASLPFRLPLDRAKRLISDAEGELTSSKSTDPLGEASSELALAKHIVDNAMFRSGESQDSAPFPPDIFVADVLLPIPSVEIPKAAVRPMLDGKLDDAVWQSAAKVKIEYTPFAREVTQPSDVRLAYDWNNMYVAFRCAEPKLGAMRNQVTEHDGFAFQDDSVELFFGLDGDEYAHLAVNAIGTRYDSKGYDTSWDPEWQTAVGRESAGWTAEIVIPFTSLGKAPTAGQTWRANFCRNRVLVYKEAENTSWSATYGSFHTPTRFGKIEFAGTH